MKPSFRLLHKMSNATRLMLTLAVFVLSLSVNSCSNRNVYNAIQENGLRACEEQPIQQQRSCREQYDTSYDEYQRVVETLEAEAAAKEDTE